MEKCNDDVDSQKLYLNMCMLEIISLSDVFWIISDNTVNIVLSQWQVPIHLEYNIVIDKLYWHSLTDIIPINVLVTRIDNIIWYVN